MGVTYMHQIKGAYRHPADSNKASEHAPDHVSIHLVSMIGWVLVGVGPLMLDF